MYVAYFGLKEPPFSLTPDPHYLYMSSRHREAFAHLLYGLGEGGGFVQLTGEIGTGKTTLCRCLLEQLPEQVDVAFILNPRLTDIELLATLCDELGITYPEGTTSLKTLVDALYRYLLDARARGRRTVLIIDEAQNLSSQVLEQIRLLTNLETTTEKLLQVILIGQPELVSLLDRPELRQLAQRVTARYHLLPCSAKETHQYIAHRLSVAGCSEALFTRAALREVYHFSKGIPRLINAICDRALLGAYVRNRRRVDGHIVRKAAREVAGPTLNRSPLQTHPWFAASVLAAIAVAVAWLLLPSTKDPILISNPPANAQTAKGPAVDKPDQAQAERKLADLLKDPAAASDQATAFMSLFSLWQVSDSDGRAGLSCEDALRQGLRCLNRSGNWNNLRLLGLPATLELITPTGEIRYALVTALGEQSARLVLGGQTLTVPFKEIEPLWFGRYTFLWKPPPLRTPVLRPGMRSKDVIWLRERLAQLGGEPLAGGEQELYDEALRTRVMEFQRRHSLTPDGVVGLETLLYLTAGLSNQDIPSLGQIYS